MSVVPRKSAKIATATGQNVDRWDNLKKGDVGDALELSGPAELHVQVAGEYSGADLLLEGSNETAPGDADWSMVTDTQGLAMIFNAGSNIRHSASTPRWIRPVVENGDENTLLKMLIAIRSSK